MMLLTSTTTTAAGRPGNVVLPRDSRMITHADTLLYFVDGLRFMPVFQQILQETREFYKKTSNPLTPSTSSNHSLLLHLLLALAFLSHLLLLPPRPPPNYHQPLTPSDPSHLLQLLHLPCLTPSTSSYHCKLTQLLLMLPTSSHLLLLPLTPLSPSPPTLSNPSLTSGT